MDARLESHGSDGRLLKSFRAKQSSRRGDDAISGRL
jgi:hypothetical protein